MAALAIPEPIVAAGGVDRLRERASRMVRVRLAPPPKLTVAEWADAYRVVSSYSAEPGPWVTERTPYLREIMDVFSDPTVNRVVFMKCARIGGTEAGQNVIGFFIDQDPSPILVVQPTVDDAKDFSKEQLGPMIEDTDCLRRKVSEAKAKDSGNTITAKTFPSGGLYLVGANSPRGFRRRTARVVVLEEVDGYPPSAGTEGDQVALAERRASTFQHRRKVYINSTPTLKGYSRIEKEFARSDQRRYHVPCPDCGHEQPLAWANLKYKDLDAPHYLCTGCGVLIPEAEKQEMLRNGRWVASNPGPSTVGFHINALYSPWVRWGELVEEWDAAQQDPAKLAAFVNTALGEVYEERSGDDMGLTSRPRWTGPLPVDVRLITAGSDVQDDRIEVIVRGWAPGEESWLVDRVIVLGDPEQATTWKQVDDILNRSFEKVDGTALKIDTLCIDSGAHTDAVYRYVKPRFQRRVFATKGYSQPGKPLVSKRPTTNNKARVKLFMIGSESGKDVVYSRLKSTLTSGAGVYHFGEAADADYFDQIAAEVPKRVWGNGRWTRRYFLPRGKRSEVLDCEVLALAALELSSISRRKLNSLPRSAAMPEQPADGTPLPATEVPLPPDLSPKTIRRPMRPPRKGWAFRV